MNAETIMTRNIIVAAIVSTPLLGMSMDVRTAQGRQSTASGQAPATAKAAGCSPATETTELEWNNVRALLTTSGLLWYDKSGPGRASYEVPKTENRDGPRALFSGGLWMGGLSPDNQLKLAAIDYREGNDFWPGPLTTDGEASVTADVCERYDRFYANKVTDAETHNAYFRCLADPDCNPATEFPDGYVIPASYFEWPAINTEPGYDTYLAPFTDVNQDGDYQPGDGDYPGFDLDQAVDCRFKFREDQIPLFGDYNIWWVLNDKGNAHTETGGQPIGLEVKSQAFAFSTNNEVNNMTFYNYVVINRGTQTLTNTYFGQFADADLGCADDDFAGCDVQRGLGFVYNWDDLDADCGSATGYGPQPPAIGIDFFEGPYQDYDEFDNPGEEQELTCIEYQEQGGIPYTGIGIGYGDGVVDNERFGMRGYVYYNREGANAVTDPGIAVHFYNYLRSIWKDGTPQTYGGTGYAPNNADAIPARYMFPGNSDPVGWGTGCDPQAPWQESAQTNVDRRFIQSAGPFTLEPGAYNNITVGVVYARATAGGAYASVLDLKAADDKAQALFDNCFRILDGPDAPTVDIQEMDRHLILYLSNPVGSNNQDEAYLETDPTIPPQTVTQETIQTIVLDPNNPDLVAPLDTGLLTTQYVTTTVDNDRQYHFQGYMVYQMKDAQASVSDLGDVSKARLVAVCDVEDGVDQLVNHIQDQSIGEPVATEMVNAPDSGVFHSLRVDLDLFATGDPRLVNYKTYYFLAIAYGYNNYAPFDPSTLTGQAFPFLAGRKAAAGSIRSYSGIPHPPSSEAGGTIVNAQYGQEFQLTRIEGQGNGGRILDMSDDSHNELLASSTFRLDKVKYEVGAGPVRIKVVDPLVVPAADFEIFFLDSTSLPTPSNPVDFTDFNDAYWKLVRLDDQGQPVEEIFAERAIEVGNEQLIPEWGISVEVDNPAYSNGTNFTPPLGQYLEIDGDLAPDGSNFWYLPIPDADGESAFNWVRSGTVENPDDDLQYPDYVGKDDNEIYEREIQGWAPWGLCGYEPFQPGDSLVKSTISSSDISESTSIEVIFTKNKEHWTRCAVVEECTDPGLPGVNVYRLKLKPDASRDKNGRKAGDIGYNDEEGTLNGAQPHGMSWFPGYCVDLETGERLNMAFGEDSYWGGAAGRDMLWNPTDQVGSQFGQIFMGGGHWIYTYKNVRRNKQNAAEMPHYDLGQYVYDNLDGDVAANRSKVWKAVNWVGSAARVPGVEFLSVEDGLIPLDMRIRLAVSKPYMTCLQYPGMPTPGVDVSRNAGLPLYAFSTRQFATTTNVNDVQIDGLSDIGVVPNPYYGFSGYETSRLDNRVKFINLPRQCTINIYNVSGTLVRQFKKDNDLTYLDWDLRNSKSVPISGGTYICHINVPGAGETVLKWFGVMRPVDLQNF